MRLLHRDKGCAVCLATRIQEIYKYSDYYEGSHIVNFACHELVSHYLRNSPLPLTYPVIIKWDAGGFSTFVSDPFTDPANADSPFASPSTRTKTDLRRMNSLENGILMCLRHHIDYSKFCFGIHPDVRTPILPYTISNFPLSRPTEYFLSILPLPHSMVLK